MKRLLTEFAKDLHLPKPPFVLIAVVLVFVPLTWLPLAFVWRANVTLSENRPINLFQDMDVQPRFDAQRVNPIFADHREMRYNPPGTVAYDALLDDDHFLLGYYTDGAGGPVLEPDPAGGDLPVTKYYRGYPSRVKVDDKLLRGQQRYNIFCYPCHGKAGYGDGPINVRAEALRELDAPQATWTTASDLHAIDPNTGELTYGETVYPEGKLFNTISNGIRNMPGYGAQITPEDRWAIVAYVRALQLSQHANERDLPADVRDKLK